MTPTEIEKLKERETFALYACMADSLAGRVTWEEAARALLSKQDSGERP